jgi:hypothetical protein
MKQDFKQIALDFVAQHFDLEDPNKYYETRDHIGLVFDGISPDAFVKAQIFGRHHIAPACRIYENYGYTRSVWHVKGKRPSWGLDTRKRVELFYLKKKNSLSVLFFN